MERGVVRLSNLLIGAALVAVLAAGSFAGDQASPELRLPPDAHYSRADGSPGPVVFSHTTHVAFADNRCTGCHPALFSILRPTQRITHAEMNAGQKCGACHDGVKTSGVQDDCTHCHQMEAGR